jgi:carboxypeptidase C (cathepsin A)
MGGLGPRRLALNEDGAIPEAPARLVDNPQTWLRFTDLVFIDPVGTGFSRALASGEESAAKVARRFWGIRSDLRALGEFIRRYLTSNDRWASPRYVAGESYGGFRAAALVDVLPAQAGIELNGAVLISPVIEYTLHLGSDYLNVMQPQRRVERPRALSRPTSPRAARNPAAGPAPDAPAGTSRC